MWWSRVRLLPAVYATVIAVMAAGAFVPSAAVPVPLVLGTSFPLPIALLLPVVPVLLVLHGQARGDAEAEKVAVRPVWAWDCAAMAGLLALAAVAATVAASYSRPVGVSMARNVIGYLGLALLARWLAGPGVANVVVALFPFVAASFGIRPSGHPMPWAWPYHAPESVPAVVLAVALLAAGVAVARRDPLIGKRGGEDAAEM